MTSVSGGGHWGGGLWISTHDLSLLAELVRRGGTWEGNQLLSSEWVDLLVEPCSVNENYGFLWWLNTDHNLWPSAPAESYAAYGFGRNFAWIDPTNDLVAVVRWLRSPSESDTEMPVLDAFLERLLAAV